LLHLLPHRIKVIRERERKRYDFSNAILACGARWPTMAPRFVTNAATAARFYEDAQMKSIRFATVSAVSVAAVLAALVLSLVSAPADAYGYGHGGRYGGRYGGGPRWGVSVGIGVPFGFWGPSYYSPYYYAYPPMVVPAPAVAPYAPAAPVYVEPDAVPAPAPAAPPVNNWWYWCASAQGYYPYVATCPEGWQRVAPQQ
jgi:hypothetical protein